MTKNYKPFIKPSVLHPHVVHETGTENPQHMYEASSDIFAAIGRDTLRGTEQVQQPTGIIGFIKEHPFLSIMAALGVGAGAVALLSSGGERRVNPDGDSEPEYDEDGNEILDGEIISSKPVRRQTQQQPTRIQLALPAPQPHSYYIQNPEPIVIKSKEQPPVTITMPSEKGVEVVAPGLTGPTLTKKRRRRKKPDKVQLRDGSGKFTSTTVKRDKMTADISKYAAKK